MEATTSVSKPKSTGERSQNNHWYGHCTDIAEQLATAAKPVTKEEVAFALLVDLADEGEWPNKRIGRQVIPMGWTFATSELANRAIEHTHWFADTYQLYLTEYIEGQAVRTIGGVHEMSDVQG